MLPYPGLPEVVLRLTALWLPELRLMAALRLEEPLLTAALRLGAVPLGETVLRLWELPLALPTVGVLL